MNLDELLKNKENVRFNDFSATIEETNKGVFFMYSCWSPSLVQLRNLLTSLNGFQQIILFIFDADSNEFPEFKKKNKLFLDGWGETFWIKSGKIIAEMKKYNSENLNSLVNNNNQIS